MKIATPTRLLLASGLVLLTTGCEFDYPLEGKFGFSCQTDDECASGFQCYLGEAYNVPDAVGRCVALEAVVDYCFDLDGDGFDSGPRCEQEASLQDCDDTDPEIFPGALEVCDGVINNCNLSTADEGVEDVPCERQIGIDVCDVDGNPLTQTMTSCVDGAYESCANATVEGRGYNLALYEPVEESCDGYDNDCDGQIDPSCECEDGDVQPCGSDAGTCTAGVRFCENFRFQDECYQASRRYTCAGSGADCTLDALCADGSECRAEEPCETDDDCQWGGVSGYCVEDNGVLAYDDLLDDVTTGTQTVKMCRYLDSGDGAESCSTSDDCGEGFGCLDGTCQVMNISPIAEVCNGLDDNCNGGIDEDGCSACTWNYLYTQARSDGASPTSTTICVARYEASRFDATSTSIGSEQIGTLVARSEAGVVPWTNVSYDEAQAACRGLDYRSALDESSVSSRLGFSAQMTLCRHYQWTSACGGVLGAADRINYPYGNDYEAGKCVDSSTGSGGPSLTGASEECIRDANVISELLNEGQGSTFHDMSGNVMEWVTAAAGGRLVGGSYLDDNTDFLSCRVDSNEVLRQQGTAADGSDVGFRCCHAVQN